LAAPRAWPTVRTDDAARRIGRDRPGDDHGRGQAEHIFGIIDAVNERARKIGGTVRRSLGQAKGLTRVPDNDADYVAPLDMLKKLRDDNKALTAHMRAPRRDRRGRGRGDHLAAGRMDRPVEEAHVVPLQDGPHRDRQRPRSGGDRLFRPARRA
jgi:hypothetical protein